MDMHRLKNDNDDNKKTEEKKDAAESAEMLTARF